jgi:hypothetical protein
MLAMYCLNNFCPNSIADFSSWKNMFISFEFGYWGMVAIVFRIFMVRPSIVFSMSWGLWILA